MLKIKTLLCISYSTCPTVYFNKHLSCLTYGRVPTKGRNYIGTRNLRIELRWRVFSISSIYWAVLFFQKWRGVGGVTVLALSALHFYPFTLFSQFCKRKFQYRKGNFEIFHYKIDLWQRILMREEMTIINGFPVTDWLTYWRTGQKL